MKTWMLIGFLLVAAGTASAQQAGQTVTKAPASGLKLKEGAHDFGKIPQGRPVTHSFEVVNTGKTPLTISNVTATCGCTTPEWSREPIAPGASAFVKVGYNAASEGPFEKSITIFVDKQTYPLLIKGDVWKSPTVSAPVNQSLQTLKHIH